MTSDQPNLSKEPEDSHEKDIGEETTSSSDSGSKDSSGVAPTRKAGGDKTITMIMEQAGVKGVELQPSSDSNISRTSKTIKKSLGHDEGIIADEDKYDVKDILAKGGMGMVMSAKDVNIRRQVAVKMMLPQQVETDESLLRFVEEAQVTGQLEHPNIVPVHELGVQPSGQVFYTMKMVKGITLKDILKKIRKGDEEIIKAYPLTRLMTIFMKICDAIAFAHDHKVIHRDLKPENIMVGDFGEVLVLDWGLAKILKHRKDDAVSVDASALDESIVESVRSMGSDDYVTMDGKVMGTPRFMAPEQARGIAANMDCRADVYSLGAILYNILVLRSHVEGKTAYEILKNTLLGEYVPLEKIEREAVLPHWPGGALPEGLKAVCKKCLNLKPDDRYQDVQDLQKDIVAWQDGYATGAENASLLRQIYLLIARHKGVFSVAAAATVIMAVFGVFAFREVVKERDAAEHAREQAVTAWGIAKDEQKKTAEALKQEEEAKKRAIYERALAIEAEENERLAKESERKAKEEALLENYCNSLHLVKARINEGAYDQAQEQLWKLPTKFRHWEWGYLLNRSSPEYFSIDTGSTVLSASASPDGRLMVTGSMSSKDGKMAKVHIWDAFTGKKIRAWSAHPYQVHFISFSPDGSRILTSGNGKVATVWDVATGKKIHSLNVVGNVRIASGVFSADGSKIITVTAPNVLSSDNENELAPVTLFGSDVKVIRKFTFPGYEAFSRTGDLLVLQTEREAIQVWDAESGDRLSEQGNGDTAPVNIRAILPDNGRIAIMSNEDMNSVRIWDVESQKVQSSLIGHRGIVRSVVFSPDGERVLTSSEDKTARLWDVATGRQLTAFSGHSGSVYCASFAFGGKLILTAGSDGSLKLWDAGIGREATAHFPEKEITCSVFSPDSKRVAFGGYSGIICDVTTGRKLVTLEGDGNIVDSLTFSPDGTQVAGVSMGIAYIWNAETGRIQYKLKEDDGWTSCVKFTPDGMTLAAGGRYGRLCFWNPKDGKRLYSLDTNGHHASSITFSKDGKRIATMGTVLRKKLSVGELRWTQGIIWDAETGEDLFKLWNDKHNLGVPKSIMFSPLGNKIIMTTTGVGKVLDAETAEVLQELKGHANDLNNASFSADDRRFITVGEDGIIRIWDALTGRELFSANDVINDLSSSAFSPDGSMFLVTSSKKESPRILKSYDWNFDKEDFRKFKRLEYKVFLESLSVVK